MIGFIYELINDKITWYDSNLIDWNNDVILVAMIFGEDIDVITECFENSEFDYDWYCLMFRLHEEVYLDPDLEKIDAWQYKQMIKNIKTGN